MWYIRVVVDVVVVVFLFTDHDVTFCIENSGEYRMILPHDLLVSGCQEVLL